MKKSLIMLTCFSVLFFSLGSVKINAALPKTTLKLSSGAVYYGEVKSGKPNGKGTMTWPGNKSYSGDWVNGKRSGYGIYLADEKEDTSDSVKHKKYTGYWKNDLFNGQGDYIELYPSENDDIVTDVKSGNFSNGIFSGGYSLHSSYVGYFFDYKDSNHIINFHSYNDSNLKNLFTQKLNLFESNLLEFWTKQSNGLMKGYSYYLGLEEDSQDLSEGTYKTSGDLDTGTSYKNTDDFSGYILSTYKNGKKLSSKVAGKSEDIFGLGEQKIQNHVKDLTPYIKGFQKVYGLSVQETKTFKEQKNNTINSTNGAAILDKTNPDNYLGTWEQVENPNSDDSYFSTYLVLEKEENGYSFYLIGEFGHGAKTSGTVTFDNQGKGIAQVNMSVDYENEDIHVHDKHKGTGTIQLTNTGIIYNGPVIEFDGLYPDCTMNYGKTIR